VKSRKKNGKSKGKRKGVEFNFGDGECFESKNKAEEENEIRAKRKEGKRMKRRTEGMINGKKEEKKAKRNQPVGQIVGWYKATYDYSFPQFSEPPHVTYAIVALRHS
jgi:hypothetical protein